MRLDDYQREAGRTAATLSNDHASLAVLGLGVAGEAGEVADALKKVLGHGHALDRDKIVKELGDVLWYVAVLADVLGVPLSTVAETNIAKLRARYPDGFDPERSRRREEHHG